MQTPIAIDPQLAALRVWFAPGVGCRTVAAALQSCMDLDGLLGTPVGRLDDAARAVRAAITTPHADETAILQQWRAAGWLVSIFELNYPQRLRRLPDPPLFLFGKGAPYEDWPAPSVAIVGARRAGEYGIATARRFAGQLARSGAAVGSGLAYGIDAAAHEGAVTGNGVTWACVAHGLDRVYPKRNTALAGRIVESGGSLISEYPPGTEVQTHHFPARNRIVAALADAVIVIEGGAKSGALITADLALDLGVAVLALPGRVDDPNAQAPLKLLKQGAQPAVDVESILDAAGWLYSAPHDEAVTAAPTPEAPAEYRDLVDLLPSDGGIHVDELAERLGVPVTSLLGDLLQLELAGWVQPLPGKFYARSTPGSKTASIR